jgi:hypothetical protein
MRAIGVAIVNDRRPPVNGISAAISATATSGSAETHSSGKPARTCHGVMAPSTLWTTETSSRGLKGRAGRRPLRNTSMWLMDPKLLLDCPGLTPRRSTRWRPPVGTPLAGPSPGSPMRSKKAGGHQKPRAGGHRGQADSALRVTQGCRQRQGPEPRNAEGPPGTARAASPSPRQARPHVTSAARPPVAPDSLVLAVR